MDLLKVGTSRGVEVHHENVTFQSAMARRAPMAIGPYDNRLNTSEADFISRHSKRIMNGT